MESRTAALLLVALVALAGCTGTTDVTTTATTAEPDAGSTTTESASESTTSTTLDPESADLPPGVSEPGVENASRLVAAHSDALSESGYRFRLVADTSLDGASASQSVSRGIVAENFEQFRMRTEAETPTGNRTVQFESDVWGNESVVLTQYSTGNRTRYQKQAVSTGESAGADALRSMRTADPARQASQSHVVRFALQSGEYEVAGVEVRNGTTLTTLRATGFNRSFGGDLGTLSRYDSTLVVDERGGVHRLNTTLAAEEMDVRYGFEVTEFGEVSVEYPSWAEQALATVNAQIEVDSEDGYFTVTNEAGDTLPSGSEIRASHAGVNATLELSDPLAAGEQAYVYYPDGDDRPVLATEPPEESTVSELQGEYKFVVTAPTGNALLHSGFGFRSASASATTGGEAETATGNGTTTTATE